MNRRCQPGAKQYLQELTKAWVTAQVFGNSRNMCCSWAGILGYGGDRCKVGSLITIRIHVGGSGTAGTIKLVTVAGTANRLATKRSGAVVGPSISASDLTHLAQQFCHAKNPTRDGVDIAVRNVPRYRLRFYERN